jgi:hypothetical protein
MWPAFSSTAAMVVVVEIGSRLLGLQELDVMTLAGKIALGAVTYGVTLLTLHRGRLAQVRAGVSSLRR